MPPGAVPVRLPVRLRPGGLVPKVNGAAGPDQVRRAGVRTTPVGAPEPGQGAVPGASASGPWSHSPGLRGAGRSVRPRSPAGFRSERRSVRGPARRRSWAASSRRQPSVRHQRPVGQLAGRDRTVLRHRHQDQVGAQVQGLRRRPQAEPAAAVDGSLGQVRTITWPFTIRTPPPTGSIFSRASRRLVGAPGSVSCSVTATARDRASAIAAAASRCDRAIFSVCQASRRPACGCRRSNT